MSVAGCGSIARTASIAAPRAVSSNETFDANDAFEVTFEGIIMHAHFCDPELSTPDQCVHMRRAILVESGVLTSMRHNGELSVPKDVDVASLRDATGEWVQCPSAAATCTVRIQGLDMKIVDKDGQPPPGTLLIDSSYESLLPHMHDDPHIMGGGLASSMTTHELPNAPASGFFEIEGGGNLKACPFTEDKPSHRRAGGKFFTINAEGKKSEGECRSFAQSVRWSHDQIKKPQLLISSPFSGGRWMPIRFTTPHALSFTVRNDPADKTMLGTPKHFVLYEKLLPQARLPKIEECDVQPCAVCREVGSQVRVPGCADSAWP